jgi:hypothetical protein
VSYFEIPPERDEEPPPRREWSSPPPHEVGVELPLERLVAETNGARLRIRRLVVYSTGFEVDLLLDWREDALARPIRGVISDPRDDAFVRLAIEFPNGASATNLDRWFPDDEEDEPEEEATPPVPTPPVMSPRLPFAGSDDVIRFSTWIWGIPEPGDVALVVEWPVASIGVTRTMLDGDAIRAAAERSELLWPAD